jgi:uncharacterized membrane protein
MGEVWVAKQTEPVKRKVALKLIKAGMDTKAVPQRFEQERQALDWLRANLAQWIKQLEDGSPEARTRVQGTLAHWRQDPDLASVRGEAALAKLPADEQPGWRQLWADVEQTLARAREENKRPEKSTKKQ